mgnify:CR=1 FL=1
MTAEARLRYYAGVFDVVEVNSSYYAIPDVRTTVQWVARTPPGFIFHIKAFAPMTGHRVRPEVLPASMRALLPGALRLTGRGEVCNAERCTVHAPGTRDPARADAAVAQPR